MYEIYTEVISGVYALFLKLEKAFDIKYGRQKYDYEEGTIVCSLPDKRQIQHLKQKELSREAEKLFRETRTVRSVRREPFVP